MTEPKAPEQPASPYGPGNARKETDRWYRRAGRKVKRATRKALFPVALSLAVAGTGVGGFVAGQYYTAFQAWGGLEDTLMETKVETRVYFKYGKLYYEKKYEGKKQLNPNMPQTKMLGTDYMP